jgi:nitrite reductase/ring-hydroxylating ferredoxin subunit/Fe-S cluster biogenesis protein NfuA
MNAPHHASPNENSLAVLTGDIARLEAVLDGFDETPRSAAIAYRSAVEALHGEALRRMIRSLKRDPAAMAALKEAAADEIVYAVLRHFGILKPSLSERVEIALESVRPMLASHGGSVELVSIEPPAIEVRFTGACDGCPASALTFHAGVKKAIEDACPEITEILQVKGRSGGSAADPVRFVSPFALGTFGDWHDVCRLADIPDGGLMRSEIAGGRVILFRRGAVVTCFEDACAHLGLELGSGEVADGIVTCPHHGFQYDLASGECLTAPEVQLQSHAVKVTGVRVEVRLAR